jgi:uncharacterized protein (TIGR03435 family)
MAFDLPKSQIEAPTWTDDLYFSIVAKLPPGTSRQRDGSEMLRSLLAERFGMGFHRETKAGTVATLRAVRGKLRVKKVSHQQPLSSTLIGTVIHTTLSGPPTDLTRELARMVQLPVIDKTGLTGFFRFEYALQSVRPKDAPSFAEAARDVALKTARQAIGPMGLRLDLGRGPVEVVVIDRLSRVPTAD